MLLISSDRFGDHETPEGHPEQPARAQVMSDVRRRWVDSGGAAAVPRRARREELIRVHDQDHVDKVASTSGQRLRLDPDTYTSAESYEIALEAAGAAVMAVEHTLETGAPAMALVRPPGHHAEAGRAMGFCLFNNIAVAAAAARAAGCERVAVIDYDVHHGNGTQWMFYEDPSVLYVSLHQFPFYPGTGAATETGRAAGVGTTLNVPLEAGASDADYDRAIRVLVAPLVRAFNPDVMLLSAGYDAHAQDPLGGMVVSTAGFRSMTAQVQQLATSCCDGRLAAVTEGGYDLAALGEGLDATICQLADATPTSETASSGDTSRVDRVMPAVRRAMAPSWPGVYPQ
jgi:acetoin utilization deacetylase AcuC-like enzyme